ncbi:carboxypeptidase inhibitor SmCI-like isoform X2 [Zootermopsis nevadensis]|uniref:carboxypeptidase inhibitor SmCI-like isoform X2 n=1 Tax=Zootermopsis nevadensis TaxID=136037 RepID=UPI000B8EA024|nr:carboxypeptidase inhibitor SmCI-like isoform X2 [Zootermopsis nevadensis]
MSLVNVFIVILSAAVMTTNGRAYYDAIVDAEGRSDDGEEVMRTVSPEDCFQPPSSGQCRGSFRSYYFNRKSRTCESFVWGGCGGNNNRFETRDSCEKNCQDRKADVASEQIVKTCNPDVEPPVCNRGCRLIKDSNSCPKCDCISHKNVCGLPAVRGHCRALLPRWRYDPATGKCAEFKFGGCDGNGNNFMTEPQCMKTCGGF